MVTLPGRSLLPMLAFCFACAFPDRTIDPADDALRARLTTYRALGAEYHLRLAPESETGRPLVIMGRLVRMEDGAPIPHHPILMYQADGDGSYDAADPADESTARLRGVVRTDSLGRFLVSSVLPGAYGSDADGRHIHTSVSGARPEAYDFYFGQFIGMGLLRWARGSDQAVVLDLKAAGDTLMAAADLPVKRYGADEGRD